MSDNNGEEVRENLPFVETDMLEQGEPESEWTPPPIPEGEHPLQSAWTLWYAKKPAKDDEIHWRDTLLDLGTFNTIEGFWRYVSSAPHSTHSTPHTPTTPTTHTTPQQTPTENTNKRQIKNIQKTNSNTNTNNYNNNKLIREQYPHPRRPPHPLLPHSLPPQDIHACAAAFCAG